MATFPKTVGGRLAASALALAILAGGLYGTASLWGNRGEAGCRASEATLARLRPLATGEVAAFEVAERPAAAPPLAFKAPDGRALTLADFRGRTVLLNLWATWFKPCKREMPALDRLQAEFGGPTFEVAAINIDTRNLDRPKAWLASENIRALAPYADNQATIFQALRGAGLAEGLPTTILVGPDGCRLGRLSGWAEWASPDGVALVRAALGR